MFIYVLFSGKWKSMQLIICYNYPNSGLNITFLLVTFARAYGWYIIAVKNAILPITPIETLPQTNQARERGSTFCRRSLQSKPIVKIINRNAYRVQLHTSLQLLFADAAPLALALCRLSSVIILSITCLLSRQRGGYPNALEFASTPVNLRHAHACKLCGFGASDARGVWSAHTNTRAYRCVRAVVYIGLFNRWEGMAGIRRLSILISRY